MTFFDSHAHLANEKLMDRIEKVITQSQAAGVTYTISIGCSVQEARDSIGLAEKFDGIYATAGLYPHDDESTMGISLAHRLHEVETMAQNPHIVAIGECGLDYTNPPPPEVKRDKKEQIALFQAQIDIADAAGLPVIIHSREAENDTFNIIESNPHTQFIWHSYTGGSELAKKLLKLDVMLAFNGIITYKNSNSVRETVKMIPRDRMLIETDSPYLVPHKLRSQGIKVNIPEYVKIVAQEIAEIKGFSVAEVASATTDNALRIFNINHHDQSRS